MSPFEVTVEKVTEDIRHLLSRQAMRPNDLVQHLAHELKLASGECVNFAIQQMRDKGKVVESNGLLRLA